MKIPEASIFARETFETLLAGFNGSRQAHVLCNYGWAWDRVIAQYDLDPKDPGLADYQWYAEASEILSDLINEHCNKGETL